MSGADDEAFGTTVEVEEPEKGETEVNPLSGEASADGGVSKDPHESPREFAAPAAAPPPQPHDKEERAAAPPRPRHWNIDGDDLWEMIERRNKELLLTKFGGSNGLMNVIGIHPEVGVTHGSIAQRVEQFGVNVLSTREPVSFLEMLLEALQDRVIQILAVAAVVSIIFGTTLPNPHSGETEPKTGWIEGFAIMVSIFVVVMVGSVNNYQKAKKFEEMEKEQSIKHVSVLRDGLDKKITTDQLVVGDIIIVENGQELTMDAIVLSSTDLKTNESAITGEPDLIEKSPAEDEKDPFLISGTLVEEGDARAMVIAVGMDSFQGRMKAALDEEGGETPLQEHLTALGDDIGKLGLAGAILLLTALSIKEVILITTKDGHKAHATTFLNFVIVAVTIIAVAIPEGLPLAVTISLAFSMKAMMEDNCMVRVLASCETMGAATGICSDKTGTLTTNSMTTVQAAFYDEEFVMKDYGIHPRTKETALVDRESISLSTKPAHIDEFCEAVSLNSTAHEAVNEEGISRWTGNKTEIGILGLCARLQRNYLDYRRKYPHEDIRQYAFSSKKKRMTTLVRQGTTVAAYTKGASEAILESCQRYRNAAGIVCDIDEEKRAELSSIILDMANQGNRTIGVATSETELSEFPMEEPDLNYIWLGVLGIQDPIRPEVPDAVEKCHSARLTVRMVTGDNINTAIAISKKANIMKDGTDDYAMTGPDFRKMYKENKEELLTLLPRLRVLARSSPNDKYVLVGMLQDDVGEVVGVTGDGTNDAPALKLADVGFAMNTGTDIAKGAADMVLLDDNFATVIAAIKWGRTVNDNIKKFLQYQLAINFAGVGLTIVGALASPTSKEPIAPVQLLWLNLIMDTLAALSLATERPEDACLERLPVYKQAPLITRRMFAFISIHGVYQFTLILIVLFVGHKWFDTIDFRSLGCADDRLPLNNTPVYPSPAPTRQMCNDFCTHVGGVLEKNVAVPKRCLQGRVHGTMIFNIFIWFQVFNVVNARKIYGEINCFEGLIDRSRPMILVFGIIVALQCIAVELFGDFMKTAPLTGKQWLWCIGLGATELVLGLFVRLLPIKDYVPSAAEERDARERARTEAAEHEVKRKADADAAKESGRQDPSLKRSMSILKRKQSSVGAAGLK